MAMATAMATVMATAMVEENKIPSTSKCLTSIRFAGFRGRRRLVRKRKKGNSPETIR